MNITFDFDQFRSETKNTLLNPKSYFSKLKVTGVISEPVLKVLVYGIIAGIVYLIFWLFKIKAFGSGDVGDAVGLLAFIKIILGSLAGLFLGSGFLLLISSVCHGNTVYEVNLRVAASLMALLPLYAILSIFSALSVYLGIVVSLMVILYFLWLLFSALVEALKCRPGNARIVCWVFFALFLIVILLNMRALSRSEEGKSDTTKPLKEIKKR